MQVPSGHVCAAAVAAVVAIATSVAYAQSETQIPRSAAGDKGKYYMLESKKVGDVVVLPITSFSPGVQQMGAEDYEHPMAFVKHEFEGELL